MEQPIHSLRAQMGGTAAENAPRRAGSLAVVIAVHVGLAALLVFGMRATSIEKKLQDLTTTVEEKVQVKAPPPPPPDTAKPPPPFVPPPEFQIQTEAPNTNAITTTSTKPAPPPPPPPPAPPPAAAPTPPEPIGATHTRPAYPPISQRLNEEGTVLLNVTIDAQGNCTDATVATSSGHPRLDQAAIDWVKARWKWKPATQAGKPVEVRSQVKFVWSLKDAD